MTDANRSYPRTLALEGSDATVGYMAANDREAVLAFARALPPHDLLFLPRDITHAKVLSAWTAEIDRGAMTTLLAWHAGHVVGCATIARDPLSWSPHVAELRVVVSVEMRGRGLGRALLEDAFALAVGTGAEKLIAQMTTDQTGAIAVFETMGYRGEALLRNHVKDRDGIVHDIVILGHDVAAFAARMEAYGLSAEAFEG